MKAVISTTYDNTYFYFLPICVWAWNRLGVDVICFMPKFVYYEKGQEGLDVGKRIILVEDTVMQNCLSKSNMLFYFDAPEHKEATYAQISRLYAASLDLHEQDQLIISDVDMIVFRTNFMKKSEVDFFDVYGTDLVPEGQLPMCYTVGNVKTWRRFFTKGRTYQECMDAELAHEECEGMRGNLWSRDQELLAKGVGEIYFKHTRSNGQNQFAQNRVDRTDINWRTYVNNDLIDAHLWRPGYTDENHAKIMELMKMKFPNEDFTWLDEYQKKYKKLL